MKSDLLRRAGWVGCFLWLWAISFSVGAEAVSDAVEPKTDGPAAGHSYHGEAFNEGPRQRAYLMGGTGDVHFKVSTNSEEAQSFFNQGLGQLHGFWYFEAERSFRQAAMLDPDCAMVYWGMAQANVNNAARAKKLIGEAVLRREKADAREQMWIDALAVFYADDTEAEKKLNKKEREKQRYGDYADRLRSIAEAYPEDVEAKAFLAVQLWINKGKGWPIKDYEENEKLLQSVLEVAPNHPIHHYRIHTWDDKDAKRALTSAAQCGQSAPGIAHMWHMPGHIYSKLHRYQDAAWQQEASARVDHAHMMRDRVMPDQIHNFAHNNEWLTRNLMHVGRVHDALALSRNMIELPRHPKYNAISGGKSGSARLGRSRLYDILTRYELWDQAIEACTGSYFEPTDQSSEQIVRWRLLGRAYFATGNIVEGLKQLDLARAMQKLERAKAAEKQAAADQDKKGKPKEAKAAKPTDLDQCITELEAHQLAAEGRHGEAFAKLKTVKGYDDMALSAAAWRSGDVDQAVKLAEKAVSAQAQSVRPLAHLAFLLRAEGRSDQAAKVFDPLRAISSRIDLDVPVFARLSLLAEDLGLPIDWRQPHKDTGDTGVRPALDTLGPFHWQPVAAPDWTLPNEHWGTTSLKQYRGKPVILLFYLGVGCSHCIEQLGVFAPMTDAFEQAGISLVGISSDASKRLIESVRAVTPKAETFAFPLLSDGSLEVFKQYRAYDDFEKIPLHGTFLLDPKGRILWQDISYEPFMDAKFLLQESKRLLAGDISVGRSAESLSP